MTAGITSDRRGHIVARSLALLLGACGTPGGEEPDPADGAGAPVAFRVVTWNVRDFFDEVDRTSPPGTEDDVPSTAQVAAKLADVGGVLRRVDADLVILQEVENLALLERLVDGPLAGAGYESTALVEAFDPRGIDVGVISKLPIDRYVSHLGEKDPTGRYLWSRDCVDVYVTVAGRTVVVLGNHLISKSGDNDERRTYQATAVRAHADGLVATLPGALVAVAGDLNDDAASAPLAPLLGDDVYEDLGARLPPAEGWTYDGWGLQRVDYLLVHGSASGWVTDVATVDGAGVDTSDHRPVTADFLIPPP